MYHKYPTNLLLITKHMQLHNLWKQLKNPRSFMRFGNESKTREARDKAGWEPRAKRPQTSFKSLPSVSLKRTCRLKVTTNI